MSSGEKAAFAAPKVKRMLVALDWNWIRGTGDLRLPPDHDFAFPEVLLWETSDATSASDTIKLKLLKLYRQYGGRLFVARSWRDLNQQEREGFTPQSARSDRVLHLPLSVELRAVADLDEKDFLGRLERIRMNPGDHLQDKLRFNSLRTEFLKQASVTNLAMVRRVGGSTTDIREFIRSPEAVKDYAIWKAPWALGSGQPSVLSQFPDVLALGKQMRLELWYLLRGFSGLSVKKRANDFEDLNYAFVGSYCDAIVTQDRNLTELCRDVLPHVKVVTSPLAL